MEHPLKLLPDCMYMCVNVMCVSAQCEMYSLHFYF